MSGIVSRCLVDRDAIHDDHAVVVRGDSECQGKALIARRGLDGVTPKSVGMQTQPYLNGCSVAGSVMRSSPGCERTLIPEIGRVLVAFTMREGTIQAWQQDWARRLAYSARQRWKQLAWDQLPGSYLNESWSFVR